MSKTKNYESNLATVMGGTHLTVEFLDGKSETVKVLQLAVEKYPLLVQLIGDESSALDLYCGKEAGWAKSLSVKSHTELIEKAEEINKGFFEAWLRRTSARLDLTRPLAERIAAATQRLSTSGSLSPKPPSGSV
jgi:hypothetical protein